MSDRVNGFFVSLREDIRDDDSEAIVNAIIMIKGVASVRPNIANWESQLAEERAKQELRRKIIDLLQ